MDEETRYSLLQLLGEAMSGLSEDCWAAGWPKGLEDYLPELCRRAVETGVPQKFGVGYVTPLRARGLCFVAELIGSWANIDLTSSDSTYVAHQPGQRTP